MSMKIGSGRSKSGGYNKRKYFKLKDGEQAYRILPGLGDLADSNRWSVFYSVHYGYKTSDNKSRPFVSPEVKNRKNGMIEVSDAAKERIEKLKGDLEKSKKAGNKAMTEKLSKLVGQLGMYNLDSNHYLNVIDAQGNIGVLKLRHKAKLALEAEIKKLESSGVYPLSPENGRYFVFTRTGMGRDTTFSVNVLKEKLTVEGVGTVERDVVHKLDDEIINRLSTEAAELDKLFKRFSSEEVREIVESSDLMTGVSSRLDQMFSSSQSEAASEAEESHEEPEAEEAPIEAAPAKAAPKISTASSTPKASKPQQQTIAEMSDEDFLAALSSGSL